MVRKDTDGLIVTALDESMERSPTSNAITRYIACFGSVGAAALAAGVTTEMLRRMRLRGYVSTRDRALRMANACGFRVGPAELLGLTDTRVA